MDLIKRFTRFCFLAFLIFAAGNLAISSSFIDNGVAQRPVENQQSADPLIVFINLQRIETQLNLTEYSLANNDLESAFQHAYIPHSVTFPVLKPILIKADPSLSRDLEGLLTDLPIKIRASASPEEANSNIESDVTTVINLLNRFSSTAARQGPLEDTGFFLQTSAFLLEDAVQSYQLSNASTTLDSSSTFNRQNALGFVNSSMANFERVADSIEEPRREEIISFYRQIQEGIKNNIPFDTVASIASAIERDFSEELDLSSGSESGSEQAEYFSTIRQLLNDTIVSVNAGDYDAADAAAIKAYLDNYEYLEAPIEKHDPDLMLTIEEEMREELRSMIEARGSADSIEAFVNGILTKLDSAEQLLKNDPSFNQGSSTQSSSTLFADIQGLQAGFGTYTGERRDIGEAEDPAKAAVRNDIDTIRMQLDETLRLHGEGNYDGALLTSRSAYLDSYESIEIPLRPIDPDFTLDMEIKFAELRNLIQAHTPYEQVESKVVEIRRGLDESERLVSGTGIVAPTIAFSTSFSIIFREGLESALIIGAILTYLEASRNNRFKKHVYYGIVIAIGATAVTWFIAEFIIDISGASRELIEAIAGVSAVAVLFWVSFWVLNKIETKRWIEFVKAKVWKA